MAMTQGKTLKTKHLLVSKPALRKLANAVMVLAAVVSLSGLSESAQAALVTRNVGVTLNAEDIETFDLDVDLNGTIDFTFTAAFVPDPSFSVGFDTVDSPFGTSNSVVIDMPTLDGFPTASRLAAGDTVAAANTFSFGSSDQGNLFFLTPFDPQSGNFEGQTGFLGLRFEGTGGSLFGFAQVTVNSLNASVNPLGLTIGTVGFNDVPGQLVQIPSAPAAVPEPGTLALLLAGFGLLAASRLNNGQRSKPNRGT